MALVRPAVIMFDCFENKLIIITTPTINPIPIIIGKLMLCFKIQKARSDISTMTIPEQLHTVFRSRWESPLLKRIDRWKVSIRIRILSIDAMSWWGLLYLLKSELYKLSYSKYSRWHMTELYVALFSFSLFIVRGRECRSDYPSLLFRNYKRWSYQLFFLKI